FSLKRDEKGSNIGFILDYFRPKADTNRVKPVKITWNIHEVDLDSVSVRYRVVGSIPKRNALNFRDIELTGISGKFSDIDIRNHLFKSTVTGLKFREKSGFSVHEMSTLAVVDTNRLELNALDAKTNRSRIRDYLLLEYANFASFDDFIDQVA